MLKKQPGFVLKKIKDSYYLLPFGQQVADQKIKNAHHAI